MTPGGIIRAFVLCSEEKRRKNKVILHRLFSLTPARVHNSLHRSPATPSRTPLDNGALVKLLDAREVPDLERVGKGLLP